MKSVARAIISRPATLDAAAATSVAVGRCALLMSLAHCMMRFRATTGIESFCPSLAFSHVV